MARVLVRTSTQLLYSLSQVVTAPPFTMACWYKPSSTGTAESLMFQGTHGSLVEMFLLWRTSTQQVAVQAQSSSVPAGAETTATDTQNAWNHACAVFASTTSRSIYLNGANKITDTTSMTPNPASITGTRIGDSDAQLFDGDIAEVAIWGVALSDAEVASLYVSAGVGVYPSDVQSGNLLAYWKVLGNDSPEPDEIGTNDLTVYNGAVQSAHLTMQNLVTPLSYPSLAEQLLISDFVESNLIGAASIPIFMNQYRQRWG